MVSPPPIFFRGTSFSATKRYFEGTHRILNPEKTWEKIASLAPKIGVTRIANITGLDRIEIPVILAIRPKALTVVTSAGKGLSLKTALVSGLMEAIELHCAEECELSFLHLSYNELIKQKQVIPLSNMALRSCSLFHPDWPERWVLGWDLFQQEEVAVPLVSVTMNPRLIQQEATELISFSRGSTGLASGNHFLEALISGIYEVIERDAISSHLYAAEAIPYFPPRVRLDTILYPSVLKTIDQLGKKGIELLLFDCTIDTQVPVFMAMVYDRLAYHMGILQGYGAHLDPEVAMIRALTEAVQIRTVLIAGSRDDIFSSDFQKQKKYDSPNERKSYDDIQPTIDARTYASEATQTFEGDIHLIMEKLQKIGISQLIVSDLTRDELGVPVLRVIIPTLEGYKYAAYSPGKRAKAFAAQQAGVMNEDMVSSSKRAHFPAGALL